LIGCSFNWALQYLGRLGAPETAALTDNDSLMGKLAHEILASVLRNPPHDGQAAFSLAEDLFDQLGPKLAAPLFLPGAPVQLGFVRKATASAARELVTILKKAGLPVIGVEYPALKESSEIALKGRLDLLAGPPPAIIDLKWSSESYHRERLKAGTAAQLAAYSFIMKSSEAFPPVAYFIIRSQHLLAQPGTPLKNEHIQIIDGPAIADTWKAFFKTSLDRLSFAQKGEFEALAIPLPDDSDSTGVVEKDELTDTGFIALAPPCKFCSFGYLCGRLWEQA